MTFKGGEALKNQFYSDEVNPFLREIAYVLKGWWEGVFKKQMVVTSIFRTPENQVQSCEFLKYKSRFEHCGGESIDIRSCNLTPDEIQVLKSFYKENLTHMMTLEYHTKGTGRHFHLTTAGPKRRQKRIDKIVKDTPGASACFCS